MKVIILAGGKGTRLPKSAKNIPKPLVKIAGKPILQHQIDLLKKHGLSDIRLSLGYKADQIIKYLERDFGYCPRVGYEVRAGTVSAEGGRARTESLSPARWAGRGKREDNTRNLSIEYIIEPEPLGTGGAIKFASRDLKEDFMVLNGDILSSIDLSKFIKFYENTPQKNVLTAWYHQDVRDYGSIHLKGEKVIKFYEKPKHPTAGYINAGFYILSSNTLKSIKKTSFSIEKDVFPKLAQKGDLAAFIHEGFWTDLGTEERLEEARKKLKLIVKRETL